MSADINIYLKGTYVVKMLGVEKAEVVYEDIKSRMKAKIVGELDIGGTTWLINFEHVVAVEVIREEGARTGR